MKKSSSNHAVDYRSAPVFPVEANKFFGRGIQPHLARRRTRTELSQIIETEDVHVSDQLKKALHEEMDRRNTSVAKDNQGQITTALVRELLGGFIHRQGRMWTGPRVLNGSHRPDILQPIYEPSSPEGEPLGWNTIEVKTAHTRKGFDIRPSQLFGYMHSVQCGEYARIGVLGNSWAYVRYFPVKGSRRKEDNKQAIVPNERHSEESMLHMYAKGTKDMLVVDLPVQLLLFSLAPQYRVFSRAKELRDERTVLASSISKLLYHTNGLEELIQQAQDVRKMHVPDRDFLLSQIKVAHYLSPPKQYFWFPAFYSQTMKNYMHAIEQAHTIDAKDKKKMHDGLKLLQEYSRTLQRYMPPRTQLPIVQFPITTALLNGVGQGYTGMREFTRRFQDENYFASWVKFAGLEQNMRDYKRAVESSYLNEDEPF